MITKKITEVQNFANGDLGTIIQVQGDEIGQTNVSALKQDITNSVVSELTESGGVSLNMVNLKGVVPTYADLALITPTPELNDAYQVEADSLVYVYTENGFQTEGNGFVVQAEPNGVVEEGNTEAVSGGEVYNYINYGNLYDIMELPEPFPGTTLTNILRNNNFDSIWGGNNYTSLGLSNNIQTWVATANGGRVFEYFPSVPGDKYYMKVSVKATSPLVRLEQVGAPLSRANHSGSGDFEELSVVFTALLDGQGSLTVSDRRAADWDTIQVKKAVTINLTSTFGAGNEPNVEEMDEILSELPDSWFGSEYIYYDKFTTNGMTFVNRGGVIVLEKLEGKPLHGKKIVCFGDSVTEFGDYPQQVANITGATVYDVGIGGTRLADRNYLPNYNDLCFVKLTEAIMAGDWSAQDIAIDNLIAKGDDNSQQYELLKSIDFNNIDIIVFMYGTNDWNSVGTKIGEDNDTETYTNIKGSLNYIYQEWNTNYPKTELYAVTPIFRYIDGSNNSDVEAGSSGLFLNEIGEAIIHMAKKYHSPCLDLYNESGINYYNALTYIIDGTHPTQLGYDLIAKKVSRFLTSK